MSDNLAHLTAQMAVLESSPAPPAPIPLGTYAETGGPSNVSPRAPLPDQRSAYDTARGVYHQASPGIVPRFGRPQGATPHHDPPIHAHNELEYEGWQAEPSRGYQTRRGREPEQDGIGKIKVKIPSFEGKCDPDVYMEWETKIEQIWTCHNFAEHKKVQLAALEFNGYALIWWDNLVRERRRVHDPDVATWEQMKALMRARFVPQHHTRDLRQRLENLREGSMSAEETYNAMQVAMVKANVIEDKETTMARYLRILNSSLANEVDLYPYSSMTELLHLAIKWKERQRLETKEIGAQVEHSTPGETSKDVTLNPMDGSLHKESHIWSKLGRKEVHCLEP